MWGTQVVPTLASFSHRGKMALANQNFIPAHDTEEILSLVSQWVGRGQFSQGKKTEGYISDLLGLN